MDLVVPKEFYDNVFSWTCSLSSQKFTINSVFTYARSINRRIMVNGISVTTNDDRLETIVLLHTVCAIYVLAFQERWKSTQMCTRIIDNLKEDREYSEKGFLGRLYHRLAHDREEDKPGDWSSFVEIVRGFKCWLYSLVTTTKTFDISIESVTRFVRVEDVIDEVIQRVPGSALDLVGMTLPPTRTLTESRKERTTLDAALATARSNAPEDVIEMAGKTLGHSDPKPPTQAPIEMAGKTLGRGDSKPPTQAPKPTAPPKSLLADSDSVVSDTSGCDDPSQYRWVRPTSCFHDAFDVGSAIGGGDCFFDSYKTL